MSIDYEAIGHKNIVYDPQRGEYIDEETGEVISASEIREGVDWRAYSYDDVIRRAHVGPGHTYKVHDGGITTFVSGDNRYSKMQKMLRRPDDVLGRREVEAKKRLNEIAGVVTLPNVVVEDSGAILKRLAHRGLIKRKNIDAVVAAVIYRVARLRRVEIDKEELLRIAGVDKKRFFKTLKRLEWEGVFDELRESIARSVREKSVCGDISPESVLDRLEVSREVYDTSIRILRALALVDPSVCSGKNPRGLLGAVVYISSILNNKRIPQQEIASRLRVSEVTIRNRYKHILDKLDIIVYV